MMSRFELGTYTDLQDNLRVRLMDIKSNRETLENAVYEPVGCGYALVAYLELPEEFDGGGIANVPKGLAEASGFSTRRIMMDARVGSMAADYPKLCPIQDVLFGSMNGVIPQNLLTEGKMPEEDPLLVLTTEDGRLGAAALFYTGIQKRISEIVGGDYYVLPSSVHEVLIMPDDGHTNEEPVPGMIIFFDWDDPDGSAGPQDGESDHTGIVERVEDGVVYTVEGNSGDSCRENHYPVGYYEILGYGVPAY